LILKIVISGPFTVFAPNDEAFAKLPSHILEGIKTNKEHLKNVLLAHVVSGKMLSTDFIDGMTSNSLLENFNLLVTIDMNGLAVNGGKVILGDVEASNGVIHVIDEVILPMEVIFIFLLCCFQRTRSVVVFLLPKIAVLK
ncbi:UNVERIFIED_CONTAM: hypothetical protein GTU68_005922, partial [Idotea baltica]|nr:hypothetical protein [Idotea baltica]